MKRPQPPRRTVLSLPKWTPGKAEARTPVGVVGVAQDAGNAGLRRGEDGRGRDGGGKRCGREGLGVALGTTTAPWTVEPSGAGAVIVGLEGGGVGVHLADRRMQFVAQAQVQREIGRDLPVVLGEEGVGVAEAVHGGTCWWS